MKCFPITEHSLKASQNATKIEGWWKELWKNDRSQRECPKECGEVLFNTTSREKVTHRFLSLTSCIFSRAHTMPGFHPVHLKMKQLNLDIRLFSTVKRQFLHFKQPVTTNEKKNIHQRIKRSDISMQMSPKHRTITRRMPAGSTKRYTAKRAPTLETRVAQTVPHALAGCAPLRSRAARQQREQSWGTRSPQHRAAAPPTRGSTPRLAATGRQTGRLERASSSPSVNRPVENPPRRDFLHFLIAIKVKN